MKTMTLVLGLMLSTTAFAQAPKVRVQNEQARINQGVVSGELTGREAVRLDRRAARLDREIARERRDGGGLSPAERRSIDRKQDRLSRTIYREKHD